MKTYHHLYSQVCSTENLLLAFKKARKGKTLLEYVVVFEKDLDSNLAVLRTELLLHSYRPLPLQTFILRDPKTRKISVSNFRDRIVHHAICNVLEPLFDRIFIFDSYANRKKKGTLAAIKRLEYFINKVGHNKTIITKFPEKMKVRGFYLKCDIKKYFDNINHKIMLKLINTKVRDKELLFLIKTILNNYHCKEQGFGMPLGNLTSQFLANVYLNELDQFVKRELKAKYYTRYVDDFVIVHNDIKTLHFYKEKIDLFLNHSLCLSLNKDKSIIQPLSRGVSFLGFRIFPYHKILKKKSIQLFYQKIAIFNENFQLKVIDYDPIYNYLEGWLAYSKQANTFNIRNRISAFLENNFYSEISTKEVNRSKQYFLFKQRPELHSLLPYKPIQHQ